KGFVLPQDAKTAFKLVRAAANGDAKIDEAQMVLAEMYLNGTGTVQNYQSAIAAYRGAVNQGNIEACRILANIYEKGVITEPNAVLAHTIYNIASSLGDAEAAKKRDTLGKTMELESLKQAQEAARAYKSAPSELTQFIRQTYGTNIRHYIDINM
ncbi:MAG: sel1 repeat family protein, partial [Alphaproteobacteria bacterium]|nr:sel1 repeat family protein [Alphaproteobacteria bacterium]